MALRRRRNLLRQGAKATRWRDMSGDAFHCGLYLPGHDPHWIQAKLAHKPEAIPPESGHLLEVREDGLVVVQVQGVVHQLWNHDPARLERLAKVNRGRITYQPGFGLLTTRSGPSSRFLFCVAKVEDPDRRPCPKSPPTGSLPEVLTEAGGFSIPGPRPCACSMKGKTNDGRSVHQMRRGCR